MMNPDSGGRLKSEKAETRLTRVRRRKISTQLTADLEAIQHCTQFLRHTFTTTKSTKQNGLFYKNCHNCFLHFSSLSNKDRLDFIFQLFFERFERSNSNSIVRSTWIPDSFTKARAEFVPW